MIPLFTPRHKYSKDQVTSLAMTIAYAVEHGIPVENALNSLLPPPVKGLFIGLMRSPFMAGILYPIFQTRANYYHGIRKTIVGLHKGLSLPECLDLYLADVLPASYRAGVHMAYDTGRQRELLSPLAQSVCRASELPDSLNLVPAFLAYLGIFLTVTSGFLYFIVPKFERMSMEMVGGEMTSPVFSFLISAPFVGALRILFFLLIISIAVWVGGRLLAFVLQIPRNNPIERFITGIMNNALSIVPVYGSYLQERLRLDALHRTYGCLMTGAPILDALNFAATSMESCQLRDRLQKLSELLYGGHNLSDALDSSKAWDPFTRWILQAGLHRENLQDAFFIQITFLSERCNRSFRFWNKVCAISFIIFIGAITSIVTIGMFEPMIKMVEHLSRQAI